MKQLIVWCFFFLLSTPVVFGQEFEVLEAIRSIKTNGDRIRKGDSLNQEDTVMVTVKGKLLLDINYPRRLLLEAGTYRLDSVIGKLKTAYARHKRLSVYLEERGLLDCKFNYKVFNVPGSSQNYVADRISILEQRSEPVGADSVQLHVRWENPDKAYKGKYQTVVQQGYGWHLLLSIIESDGPSVNIVLNDDDEPFMQYTVLAGDCRASQARKIKAER